MPRITEITQVPHGFEHIGDFGCGLAPVCDYKGKRGYINGKGDIIIPPEYDNDNNYLSNYDGGSVYSFSEGIVVVSKNGKYGCMDVNGNLVIPLVYDYLSKCKDGLIRAYKDKKSGFLNKDGDTVIPFVYDIGTIDFSDGLAPVCKNGVYGYINKNNETVIPFRYKYAQNFSEGLAAVDDGSMYDGYINTAGETVIPFKFIDAEPFKEGFAMITDDDIPHNYRMIDKNGVKVRDDICVPWEDFSEGVAEAQDAKRFSWGYMGPDGLPAIPFIYDHVKPFCNGLACVRKITEQDHGYMGFINKYNQTVVPFKYDEAYSFSNGLAVVRNGFHKCGYVDTRGNEIIKCAYDSAGNFMRDDSSAYIGTPRAKPPAQGYIAAARKGRVWYIIKTED